MTDATKTDDIRIADALMLAAGQLRTLDVSQALAMVARARELLAPKLPTAEELAAAKRAGLLDAAELLERNHRASFTPKQFADEIRAMARLVAPPPAKVEPAPVATVPLVESAVVVDGLPRVVAVITFQKDAHAYLYCRDAAQAKAIAALLSSARVAKTGERKDGGK